MDKEDRLLRLYDISMSIGNTLDLQLMLDEAVTKICSRLECLSVAIYHDGDLFHACPDEIVHDPTHERVAKSLLRREHEGHDQPGYASDDERHYHRIELMSFGVMVLTTLHRPLDDELMEGMRAIGRRLADAIDNALEHARISDSNKRLVRAQHIARFGDWSMDLSDGRIYWSDGLFELAGRKRHPEMSWQLLSEWVHPDTILRHEQYFAYLRRSRPGDRLLDLTSQLIRPDGESRWLEISSAVDFDHDGIPRHLYGTAQDITEQKLLQVEIESNRSYLQSIFDVSPNIMITTDGRNIEKVNTRLLDFFGYKSIDAFRLENDCICDQFIDQPGCLHADMEGENWLDYVLARPTQTHQACMLSNAQPHHFIVKAQQLDASVGRNSVVIFTDVTPMKQLQEELRGAKTQFDLFMRHLPHVVVIRDESDRVIYVNQKAQEYLQSSPLGRNALENLGPEGGKEVIRLCEESRRRGQAAKIIRLAIGAKRYVTRVSAFTIPQEDGKVYLGMVYTDITKESADQHEIAMFKEVIEKSPLSIIITDIRGNIEYANPWSMKLTGYKMEELLGKNPRILKSDYHVDGEYTELWKTISRGDVWSGVFKNIKKDGREFWEAAIISPVVDENGQIENYIAIKEEITEKIYLQQELAKQGEKSRELGNILDESLNEIYIFDKRSLLFLYVNRGARENIGWDLDELLAMTPLDIRPLMTREKFMAEIGPLKAKEAEELTFSTLHQRKDGTRYPVDVFLQSTRFEGIEAYVAMIIDTTEREQMQKALKDQEEIMIAQSRHAAMGEMIAMIAHQWRQPITVISMGANNMLLDVEIGELSSEEIVMHSRSILKQTEHLAKTINDFSDFFRPRKARELVSLESVIDEAEKIIGTSLRHSEIDLRIEIADRCLVQIYSRELLQVYVNLLKNAQDALVMRRERDREITVRIYAASGNMVTEVCDNGGGIDKGIINRVFEPYFSTKLEKNGTGLGLYMSKTIIEKHLYGTIEAVNIKEGVCMVIRLPIKEEDRP